MSAGDLICRVFVPGRSRTKGSLKPLHQRGRNGAPCKIGLTEDHALSGPWKKTMMRAMAAQRLVVGGRGVMEAYAGAVEVHAFFRFEQERSVAEKTGGQIVPSHATPWPTTEGIGDVDKLWRNVLDALTQAHVIKDDSLVVGGMPYKRWCRPGEAPGVLIVVTEDSGLETVLALETVLEQMP